jgi:hypothetical protein
MFADRLIELRPLYKETLGAYISIFKGSQSDKSLSDEDVWFSHLEIMDDSTIMLYFLVLTFDTRQRMLAYTKGSLNGSSILESTRKEADEKPWYGSKRFDIVDHCLKLQEKKDAQAYRSAVQEAALKAQKPFATLTMKEISQDFKGPPKYLN